MESKHSFPEFSLHFVKVFPQQVLPVEINETRELVYFHSLLQSFKVNGINGFLHKR